MSQYTFLCFDTETTGLPKNFQYDGLDKDAWSTARLLELGCILFVIDTDKHIYKIKEYSLLRKYVMNDEEFNTSNPIHGITNEDLEKGVEIEKILKKFRKLYNRAHYIIGHNVDFDINVLVNEFNLDGDYFCNELLNTDKKLCTAKYKHQVDVYDCIDIIKREKYIKLINLYTELFPDKTYIQHRALTDAVATAECFVKELFTFS